MKNFIKIYSVLLLCLGMTTLGLAQNVGINNTGAAPDNSAMLDISSTNKGVLIPRMDSTSRVNITNPAHGLLVYDSTFNNFYVYEGNKWAAFGEGGDDNLGNHIAEQNLQLKNNWLSNDGDSEGIYVDAAGLVGMGIQPSTDFHVSMGQSMEVNTGNTATDWFTPSDFCQSFTVTKDGELHSIDVIAGSQNVTAVTYNLYEGHGTGGALIVGPLNQADAVAPYLFSGVYLVQGQSYTLEVLNPTGLVTFDYSIVDEYSGGSSCYDPEEDFGFEVNMLIHEPGFRINDSLFQINDYTLPIADGTTGQILMTDGAGTTSWTTIVNTDAQDLSISNDTLSLSNDSSPVDLSGYLDNTDSQDLSLSNNILSVTSDAIPVDLSIYLDNTDAQNLNLSGNTLSLSNDTSTIDLSAYLDNIDAQSLSRSGDTLSLSNDATPVDLSAYLDNTDSQILSISNDTLYLSSDGTSIDLSPFTVADNLAGHTATQTLQLNGNWISNDGGANEGININDAGQVGINTVPTTNFQIDMGSGTNFQVDNAGVTINEYTLPPADGTANQVLVTDGNGTVNWVTPVANEDNLGNHSATQNLQLNGNWLSGDGGNEGIRIGDDGKVGFGRPVGTIGTAKTEYYGPNASLSGPHIQAVGSADDHPMFQQLNWTHDNMAILFDAYYDSQWRSSDGSNYCIYKIAENLQTFYGKGHAQGDVVAWQTGTSLSNTGRFGIGRIATTNKLEVEGEASKSSAGSWIANSDARLKKNISPLSSQTMLDKLLTLQGITYEWEDHQTGIQRPEGIHYGFTAQNIQEVFPTLVTEDQQGYLQTPYDTYDAMTVEALRALNEKITQLEMDKANLESEVQALNVQNEELENHSARLIDLKASFTEFKTMLEKID